MRQFSLIRNFLLALAGFFVIHTMNSCGTTKGLILVRGPFDTAKLSVVSPIEPVVRKGDILSIIVFSDNPDATRIYNQSLVNPGIQTSGNSSAPPGYQVDVDGNIVFQGLGKIKVEGLTKAALKDTLDERLTPFLQHPYYSIRFLNYKFTMMGEVGHPGIVSIPGERVNMLEAIALAGDLTPYANRDSIFIIRETNNKREFAWMNLTKPEIMSSPYFYIQQNDIIIVEPNKKKSVANDIVTQRNITLGLAIISTFAVLYSIFR